MQCVFFIVVFFFLSNRGLTMKKGLFAVLHVFFFLGKPIQAKKKKDHHRCQKKGYCK